MSSEQQAVLAAQPDGVKSTVALLQRWPGAKATLGRPDSHLDALVEAGILRRSDSGQGVSYEAYEANEAAVPAAGGDDEQRHERPDGGAV